MIVCICNNVSERDIAREAASGCPSFGQLQMRTGVGAGCGACHECALQTFVEHRSACPGRSSAASHGSVSVMRQASAVA